MPICPRCGFESPEETATCPLCRARLRASASGGGAGEGAGGAAAWGAGGAAGPAAAVAEPAAAAEPPPWEDPRAPFPRNLIETWRESLLEPTRFFARLPYGEPLARPLLYFLIVSILFAFFSLWWQAIGLAPFGTEWAAAGRFGFSVFWFFLYPIGALVGLGFTTLVLHLLVLILVPGRRDLSATFRVACYAAGPSVFGVVPFLGGLVAFVWGIVLQVIGLREAHRTTTGRAAAVVLIPVLLVMALIALAVLFAVLVAGIAVLEAMP